MVSKQDKIMFLLEHGEDKSELEALSCAEFNELYIQ